MVGIFYLWGILNKQFIGDSLEFLSVSRTMYKVDWSEAGQLPGAKRGGSSDPTGTEIYFHFDYEPIFINP